MDKTIRNALLKTRFKAIGGIPLVCTGIRRPKQCPAKPKRVYMPWPDIVVDLKRLPKDMLESGHKPMPILSVRRNVGESALTRISRKLCLKLPNIQP